MFYRLLLLRKHNIALYEDRRVGIGLDSRVLVCIVVDNKTPNKLYVTGMNRFNVIIRQQQ